MKALQVFLLIILNSTIIYAQPNKRSIENLVRVDKTLSISENTSIVYGTFIQRLGFSSGGFDQNITLLNTDTNETFFMEVKPKNRTKKENTFMFYIKPGFYIILNYNWTKSKFFGFEFFTEPIYKGFSSENVMARIRNGEIKKEDLKLFSFTVRPESITYVGQWDFSSEIVRFENKKTELDSSLVRIYKSTDFGKFMINIPD